MGRYTTAIVFAAFFALAGLMAMIPFVFADQVPGDVLKGAGLVVVFEVLVLLIMCVLPVAWRYWTVGIKAFTEPLCIMSASFVLYYVLRAPVLLFRGYLDTVDRMLSVNPATNRDLAVTLGYCMVGLCMFHLGYRFWNPPRPFNSTARPTWSTDKVNRLAIVGVGIAAFSTLFGIVVSGGISGVLSNFGRLREVTGGYGYGLLGMTYWGMVFAFLLQDRLRRHKSILAPLALLGIANICDAFQGNRNGVLSTWITGLLLYLLSLKRGKAVRSVFVLGFVLVAGLAFALPMARAREYAQTVSGAIQVAKDYWTKDIPHIAVLASDEFCALDAFSLVIATGPSEFPFRYGGTYLDGILFVVPRSMWPDKPKSFSFALGQYIHGVETDLPPGLIGELYLNFHVAGIVFGMYLIGLLLRKAHQGILSGNVIGITVYAVLIPYLIAFMGRSFIGGGTLVLIQCGLLLPVIFYLRHQTAPTQAREPVPQGGTPNYA